MYRAVERAVGWAADAAVQLPYLENLASHTFQSFVNGFAVHSFDLFGLSYALNHVRNKVQNQASGREHGCDGYWPSQRVRVNRCLFGNRLDLPCTSKCLAR
jgi:hypothetical protein